MIANYWFLALCAVIAAPVALAGTLFLDRSGGSSWLVDRGLAPVRNADAAQEVVGVVAAVDAAFITLYFSISLIVLTIAAGNLGVRLIDRWLGRRLVRVSIAGLSFTLVYSVLALAAIDAEAALERTPLATVALAILFLAINVAMLAVALHDLGRTMFVDKAIQTLARDAIDNRIAIAAAEPFGGDFAQSIGAPRDGYVEGVDIDYLADRLALHGGVSRICVAPGQHVLEGETIARFEREFSAPAEISRAIPIGPFRSDSQGSVFQVRLLVEVAARALSPAVNDFYTALAAVDALAEVLARHSSNWVDDHEIAVSKAHPHIEIVGQDFRALFDNPLNSLRQAAADYPSVAIRLITNYGRVISLVRNTGAKPGLVRFISAHASALCEHAQTRSAHASDKFDLRAALAGVERATVQ